MNQDQGLIKLIVIIIIVAVTLGYFGINLDSIWHSEAVQKNLKFLWNWSKYLWENYLKKPANFLWGAFYNYIWLAFTSNMERIKEGKQLEFMDNTTPKFEDSYNSQN